MASDEKHVQTGTPPAEDSAISKQDVERRVLEVIAKAMDRPVSEIHPSSTLEGDLGAQSLDYLDIAFSLEREFRIQFPRADFLQRASDHFGEENLVHNGVVTPLGLKLLATGMPELDPSELKPGLKVTEVRQMFIVATFIRVVLQLLKSKAQMDRKCPKCGAEMAESLTLPEFSCSACGNVVPLPSGDEILFQHVLEVERKTVASGTGDSKCGFC
jgi:acyl carrier protein